MSKKLRSPLSNARGNGSAHEGAHHWIMQRITAIANLFLVLWFVVTIVSLVNGTYEQAGYFMSSPVNAALLALLVISTYYHAALGLQVVIEDYVSSKVKKIISLLVIKLGLFALGAASILAIFRMHFAS